MTQFTEIELSFRHFEDKHGSSWRAKTEDESSMIIYKVIEGQQVQSRTDYRCRLVDIEKSLRMQDGRTCRVWTVRILERVERQAVALPPPNLPKTVPRRTRHPGPDDYAPRAKRGTSREKAFTRRA